MTSFIGIIAFLFGLFVPAAPGEPSLFDTILATLFGLWAEVGPEAAKTASFIDQIPA
ncbi:MAG: hypothetical protein ACYTG0_25055 [Planctomycetota bacterium]|jgi:hypothetical protein